jgi:hypothetical protein
VAENQSDMPSTSARATSSSIRLGPGLENGTCGVRSTLRRFSDLAPICAGL